MSKDSWQPNVDMNMLQSRASLYRFIREFFDARRVLEVETPIISPFATVDPFIESLAIEVSGEPCYLQTSPEFFLKRLLAQGSGDIYSLAKAFRQGEQGRRHNAEFTLLEWYRVAWDEHQLMDEVAELITSLIPTSYQKISYRDLFLKYLDIDPHAATGEALEKLARKKVDIDVELLDKSTCLDLLMTHCIEPCIACDMLFIYNYPAEQAALARLDKNEQGQLVARRFEVYLQGMELANGYFELTCATEQKKRFENDVAYRVKNNLSIVPYDKELVAALDAGMPECAGVALGVDRLLMVLEHKTNISEVLSFIC